MGHEHKVFAANAAAVSAGRNLQLIVGPVAHHRKLKIQCRDGNVPDVKVNDIAYIYSDKCKETGIDYNAGLLGTIGYELTCAVALRIPRVIISGGEVVEVVRYGLI